MARKRPSVDDPELRRRLLDAISVGVPVCTAAILAGIRESTFYDWQTKGRRDKDAGRSTKWSRFAEDVQRARARAEGSLVADLRRLAQQDGRILMSMLARLYPETWGQPGKRVPRDIEQQMHLASVRKMEADARLTEARAKALEHAVEGGGSVMLMPQDVLHTMPSSLRAELVEHLGERGITVLSPPALGAGVTDREIAEATPAITIDAETS